MAARRALDSGVAGAYSVREGVMAVEITNPKADGGRQSRTASPGQPDAAAVRPVSHQESGEAVPARHPAPLPIAEVLSRHNAGTVLLDPREPAEFAAGHVRGAITLGLQGRFEECAGAVLQPDRDVVLVGDREIAAQATARLGDTGYDRVIGQLDDLASVLSTRPELTESSSRLSIEQLAELQRLEPDLPLIDVRTPAETAQGTLPGAREIPLAILTNLPEALDRSAPVLVYSTSGFRSLIAASVLQATGFTEVADLLGGYRAWESAGLRVARAAMPDAAAAPEVGARAAAALVAAGALMLDVREPDEWQAGHVAQAWLLPMGQVARHRSDLPRDRRIVVVCRSGAVAEALRAWGFDAVNLSGGMTTWAVAGLPLVTTGPGSAGLVVHRIHPLNCETSIPALIGGVVMPNARFYVRNHFESPRLDPVSWRLKVDGLVEHPLRLSLRDLHNMRSETLVASLECAGNGRSTFDPPADGEQWQLGAVSTAEWTGVPLAEILDRAGLSRKALDIVFRGADRGNVGEAADPIHFERSLPVTGAGDSGSLLAYAMNGEPLPLENGYPLRLIVPGWYAVASVKWLTEIEVIGSLFTGFFQTKRYVYETERNGTVACQPVRLQQVRSVITQPSAGLEVTAGDLVVRGVAWSGAAPIDKVEVSIGSGPWQNARLIGQRHRHSWQWWELPIRIDDLGGTVLRARATDLAGRTQPERPHWNRLGYGGNAMQNVPLLVR
jgi:DMSO/TMAO reductase YedYZ molybdopterin-dependent catalytic subunit/rhodanese-related sulfurtransferase